jgi:hypothetical protein
MFLFGLKASKDHTSMLLQKEMTPLYDSKDIEISAFDVIILPYFGCMKGNDMSFQY